MFQARELHKRSANSEGFLGRTERVQLTHNFYGISDEKFLASPNLEETRRKPKASKRYRNPKRGSMMSQFQGSNNSFNLSFRNFNDKDKKNDIKRSVQALSMKCLVIIA